MTDTTTDVAVQEPKGSPARVAPATVFKSAFDQWRPVITKLLPPGMSIERYMAQGAQVVRSTPSLLECFATPAGTSSVIQALCKSAALGLEPNDNRNLAWIIPYKGIASWQLGYGGIMELARRAEPGLVFSGDTVRAGDEFDFDVGNAFVHHKRSLTGNERGEAYAWWVKVRRPSGMDQLVVLDRHDVERHRRHSKQPDGKMWTESYDQGALKSCVVDLRRWLPQSPEMADAIANDGETIESGEA